MAAAYLSFGLSQVPDAAVLSPALQLRGCLMGGYGHFAWMHAPRRWHHGLLYTLHSICIAYGRCLVIKV